MSKNGWVARQPLVLGARGTQDHHIGKLRAVLVRRAHRGDQQATRMDHGKEKALSGLRFLCLDFTR